MAFLFKLDLLNDIADIPGFPIEALKESQCFIYRELLGELCVLKLDSEQLPQIARVRLPAAAEHLDTARVSCEKAFADLDRSRLAGAVGAEEAEALPSLDLEVETIDGDDVIIGFPESLDSEGRRGVIERCHHRKTRSVTTRGQ